jgi:hypothetical protein
MTASRAEKDRRYNTSEKGRARRRRYDRSPKGNARYARFNLKRAQERLRAGMAQKREAMNILIDFGREIGLPEQLLATFADTEASK